MKVQNTNTPMVFQGLKYDNFTMKKELFEQVKNIPVVKKFGKNYDATLTVDMFLSRNDDGRRQFGLGVYDIAPKSIKARVKSMFSSIKPSHITLKTHAQNESDFLRSLNRSTSNTLLDIYENYKNI